ncbi:MAG: hypothetical protein N2747_09250 [Chitinophagaceae bacterium]|nr:hypothetical protein [Chitinophagaceae bacterium]
MHQSRKLLFVFYFVFYFVFLFWSCNKNSQGTLEDLVIKAMTDGQWKITNFSVNGNNITNQFGEYRFKYYSNRTVDAIKNGLVEQTGQWDGNSSTMTTWANFPNAAIPLSLINGYWKILRNSWTYVEASQTSGSETKLMRLDKQ